MNPGQAGQLRVTETEVRRVFERGLAGLARQRVIAAAVQGSSRVGGTASVNQHRARHMGGQNLLRLDGPQPARQARAIRSARGRVRVSPSIRCRTRRRLRCGAVEASRRAELRLVSVTRMRIDSWRGDSVPDERLIESAEAAGDDSRSLGPDPARDGQTR